METKIGIAGLGAIGGAVAKALTEGIQGYTLHAVSELDETHGFGVPTVSFDELAQQCDLIIEALPPAAVPALCKPVLENGKDLILISSSALLMFPDILAQHKTSDSRIIVPSGALSGMDGVRALAQLGINSAKIATTKPPRGYKGAPYIKEQNIDLDNIKEKTCLFTGNALQAAQAFPANVNVAATLSFAGIGAEKTRVEIWADPEIRGNAHEITVESDYSRIFSHIENMPDPKNPKTSVLAAQSILAILKNMKEPLVVL